MRNLEAEDITLLVSIAALLAASVIEAAIVKNYWIWRWR